MFLEIRYSSILRSEKFLYSTCDTFAENMCRPSAVKIWISTLLHLMMQPINQSSLRFFLIHSSIQVAHACTSVCIIEDVWKQSSWKQTFYLSSVRTIFEECTLITIQPHAKPTHILHLRLAPLPHCFSYFAPNQLQCSHTFIKTIIKYRVILSLVLGLAVISWSFNKSSFLVPRIVLP